MSVLLLSTVQVEAIQNNNNQINLQNNDEQILSEMSNILDKFKLDETNKKEILSNISKINYENTLNALCRVLNTLHELYNLSGILDKLQEAGKTEQILTNIIQINDKDTLNNLN